MTGAIYAQNHPWIFSSLSTPILIIYFNSILKTKLRQTVRFHRILSICSSIIKNFVIFVLGRWQIW